MPKLFMVVAKGTQYRYVSLHSLFIKSTAVVLHDCTLGWRHHSHTESSLAVKSVWACYMPDNILVNHTPVQLKSFYCFSTCDVTRVRNCTKLSQGGPGPRNEASKEVCWEQRNVQIVSYVENDTSVVYPDQDG